MDKKEGFRVYRPIPNALETATVVHVEAQVASCSQQGMLVLLCLLGSVSH